MKFEYSITESALSAADTAYAIRFVKLLITPWKETSAYNLDLIDEKGKRTKKKIKTREEKAAYTIFHRLVYNIKRLTGNSRLTSWVSALFLLREYIDESEIIAILNEQEIPWGELRESTLVINDKLRSGIYKLQSNIASPKTGDFIALEGSTVTVNTKPYAVFLGVNIYDAHHTATNQTVFITSRDIMR